MCPQLMSLLNVNYTHPYTHSYVYSLAAYGGDVIVQ